MRLIDADETIQKIKENIDTYYTGIGGYYLAEDAIDEIDAMPTVDTAPIKHGYWIESKEHFYLADGTCKEWTNFYCSNCDASTSDPRYYCPWCGAKMDLKE